MQLPKTLSGNLAFLITTVAQQYRMMFDHEMQPLGLTRSQWWLLTHIHYFGSVSQAKLAEILDVDKSGVARLLTTLEKKGWIVRSPHARDGRIMQISLAPRIHKLMEDITSLSELLVKQSLGELSRSKINDYQAGLAVISDRLEAMINTTSPEAMAIRLSIQKNLDV